jgi:hypothetical protein
MKLTHFWPMRREKQRWSFLSSHDYRHHRPEISAEGGDPCVKFIPKKMILFILALNITLLNVAPLA